MDILFIKLIYSHSFNHASSYGLKQMYIVYMHLSEIDEVDYKITLNEISLYSS